jgi:hypothetical protein
MVPSFAFVAATSLLEHFRSQGLFSSWVFSGLLPKECSGTPLAPNERREEGLQFGEADRLLRKLKAALISNFTACTNECAKRGAGER